MRYESPISHGSEVMIKVKVFLKVGQMSRSPCQKLWIGVKGLVTRITQMRYGSPISHGSEVMIKVKIFFQVGQMSR